MHDVETLRGVFRQGKRLFLLNPPAAPFTDTAVEERKSLNAILAALHGSGLEKVVAESTYGAQPGAGLHFIEGSQPYSASDVAAAFASVLGKPVNAVEIPRSEWQASLKQQGFSDAATESFVTMTTVTLKSKAPIADNPTRGTTSLQQYIEQLVKNQKATS